MTEKIGEIKATNITDDWRFLFETIEIGVIIIEQGTLKVNRYSSGAKKIFKKKLELGSSIINIDHELVDDDLISGIKGVFEDSIPAGNLISTRNNEWYVVRIEPYGSVATVDEVVLSFVDVTNLEIELEEKIKAEKKLQSEILNVEKKERWRLGQFLHDTTAQNLLSIKMLFDLIHPQLQQLDEETREELEKIKRLIVKSEKTIRELSHFVLPIEDEGKISEAFQKLVEQTEDLYKVKCIFESENDVDKIEDTASASSLYYISQEAISNAIHHGQADKITITLSWAEKFLYLIIKDNGVGYDESEKGKGMGINIMKHRAELLGGTLEIKKSPEDGGTIVKCSVPFERTNQT